MLEPVWLGCIWKILKMFLNGNINRFYVVKKNLKIFDTLKKQKLFFKILKYPFHIHIYKYIPY